MDETYSELVKEALMQKLSGATWDTVKSGVKNLLGLANQEGTRKAEKAATMLRNNRSLAKTDSLFRAQLKRRGLPH